MTKDFYNMSVGDCLSALKTTKNGLETADRQARLLANGPNQLQSAPPPSLLKMFFRQFLDIMTIILLVAALVSMTIAVVSKTPAELVDGLIILGIVLANAFIGFWQERKAQKSMEELKKLTEAESKILQNGKAVRVSSKSVVVGDILVLEAGDIVPADARLIESVALRCDESALTGESVPANKDHKAVLPHGTILAEQKNMVFGGTTIASGRALAVVSATGQNAEIGKIASLLSNVENTVTPLQKSIKNLAKITSFVVLTICAITFFVEFYFTPTQPLEAFLTAVAIAVAAIPESLPAVITIIISLGIFRLSRQKAIIKNLHALETLGCCQVICSDKTGTLTQNKMEVQTIFTSGEFALQKQFQPVFSEGQKLLQIMLLCESVEEGQKGYIGDPTELALVNFAEQKSTLSKKKLEKEFVFFDEIPFDSNRKMMSSIRAVNGCHEVFCKGAVDELLAKCTHIELCGKIVPLLFVHKEKILKANKEMASSALRVLAFAHKKLPKNFQKKDVEENLVFVGLAGMFDPPRKEVKKAVERCKRAGVRPVMITGDHKSTAFAIAKKIGISASPQEVITGAEIDKMPDHIFEKIIATKHVFARVSPENKVRIVQTLKKQGLLVAMTGDGVNDAPSIKQADIGIGMGQSGTDVTKEASDVIITDDNFATIVVAIAEGRKTYANIKKTVQFLFTANLAEITAIFLATIFLPTLKFLTPVQILFVNLLSDTLPAIALGVEPAEKDLMNMPPRNVKKGLFSDGVGAKILVVGFCQGLIMLSCFLFGLWQFESPEIASTMAFYALNIVQFFYFVSMRTSNIFKNPITKNRLAVWAVLSCFLFVFVVAISPLAGLLGLVALPFECWLFIALASAVTFVVSELTKHATKK